MTGNNADMQIVQLFIDRDEEALRRTQRIYGRFMRSLSNGILNNDADAEECVNDALMALWAHIPPERPNCFKAYLTKTVQNLALMMLRKKNSQKRAPGEYSVAFEDLCETLESSFDTEKAFDQLCLREEINRFLRGLNTKKRYVFIARYCHGAAIGEIADELGVTERAVFGILASLKKQLKKTLEKRD